LEDILDPANFGRLDPNGARMAADFRVLPDPPKTADPSAPLYLDETAVHMPSVALACAARETLHMGDVVQGMLRQAMTALMSNDRKLVAEVSRMDNIVDRLDEAIKLYVTKVTRESLDDRDGDAPWR
jgi:phosphate:Na+ symporter